MKRKVVGSALAMVLLAAAVAGAAQPPVLTQVPDDVGAVLVVKNLKQLATKMSNAGTRMKLPVPEDLLATVMGKFGLADGLDQNGSAAFLFLEVGKEQKEAGPPPMVMIIPTSDSKAMLQSMESQTPDAAGIMKVTVNGDEGSFAAVSGKYLLVAPSKESLTKYMARTGTLDKKLSPASLEAFDTNDVVFYANVPAFGPKAGDAMDAAHDEMMINLSKGMDKVGMAMASEAMDAMFVEAKGFLTDTSAALVTLRVDNDGVTFGAQGQFKPESKLGKLMAAQKNAAPANFAGFPDGKVLFAGAGSWDKDSFAGMMMPVLEKILNNPDFKESPKQEEMKKLLDSAKQIMAGISGERAVFYQPADPADGVMNLVGLYDMEDPQKAIDMTASALKMITRGDAEKSPQFKVESNAVTMKGIALTRVTINSPDAQFDEVMKKAFGPNGMTMYFAAVGKHMLTVVGGSDKFLESAVVAAQGNDDAIAKNPEFAKAQQAALPHAMAVGYLPVMRLAQMIRTRGMEGAEAPEKVVSPAIGMSAAVSGSDVKMEMRVPMGTLIDLSTAVQDAGLLKLMMGM